MKKLILVLVVVAAATGTVPQLRERVEPVVGPAIDTATRAASATMTLVANSIFRWTVQRELRLILDQLELHLAGGQRLPPPDEFPAFLRRNRMGGSIDPWGGEYYLMLARDSIIVGSAGPDGEPGSEDDLRATMPWK